MAMRNFSVTMSRIKSIFKKWGQDGTSNKKRKTALRLKTLKPRTLLEIGWSPKEIKILKNYTILKDQFNSIKREYDSVLKRIESDNVSSDIIRKAKLTLSEESVLLDDSLLLNVIESSTKSVSAKQLVARLLEDENVALFFSTYNKNLETILSELQEENETLKYSFDIDKYTPPVTEARRIRRGMRENMFTDFMTQVVDMTVSFLKRISNSLGKLFQAQENLESALRNIQMQLDNLELAGGGFNENKRITSYKRKFKNY